MTAELLESQTYLPDEHEQLASVASFLDAHHRKSGDSLRSRYLLVGADEGEQIELPESLHKVLVQAVAALTAGKAVTISPTMPKVTTQQAADLLGVSRPTVVRLIDAGELRCERIGNRRKILLADLLAYRETRRQRQYQAIADTSVDIDENTDPALLNERLKRIRKQLAEQRRNSTGN
ncbi:helix-turn-helix domain-containing protein [Kribbella sandramycini]|uniref:Excisionase family DNA binding protein n=1 Tax=Kribbella sandramycini TaxID=60450 RepID=A0A7Y4L6Z9_9ACTN|nr:helix-turn-helix domain-containing protein [Kribbella sandramycini]MBB6566781.1 excisionase family DNA binding protein [Kribbella sandramycini]NOL45565.1 helix-turn-helix domain-containing protein [Kribbella sandramycini]